MGGGGGAWGCLPLGNGLCPGATPEWVVLSPCSRTPRLLVILQPNCERQGPGTSERHSVRAPYPRAGAGRVRPRGRGTRVGHAQTCRLGLRARRSGGVCTSGACVRRRGRRPHAHIGAGRVHRQGPQLRACVWQCDTRAPSQVPVSVGRAHRRGRRAHQRRPWAFAGGDCLRGHPRRRYRRGTRLLWCRGPFRPGLRGPSLTRPRGRSSAWGCWASAEGCPPRTAPTGCACPPAPATRAPLCTGAAPSHATARPPSA